MQISDNNFQAKPLQEGLLSMSGLILARVPCFFRPDLLSPTNFSRSVNPILTRADYNHGSKSLTQALNETEKSEDTNNSSESVNKTSGAIYP